MSNTKLLCLGAAALMVAFYLSKRGSPATNAGKPGYFFDGYGWVSNSVPYNYG